MKEIEIPLLCDSETQFPTYGTAEAAGADVRACLTSSIVIASGESVLIPTGIKVEIPHGYEIQVRPRSGLALKYGVTVLNTPGTIDSDYRGEIQVILINHGKNDFEVTPEMRIAQLVVSPVTRAKFVLCEAVKESTRGSGGFGHTGTH